MAIVIDFFALNLALPDMAHDLGVTATSLQWVISGYMVSLAACFVAGGRLGDILGRRKMLIAGAIIFGATSLVCGFAPNASTVIVFRFIQGVGAAIMWPVGVAIVTNAFPREKLQGALGVIYGIGAIGTGLGPIVGGMLTEFATWRFVFWINAPIAAVVVLIAATSIAESRDETVPKKIDWAGLALITGGLVLVVTAVDEGQFWGWLSVQTIAVFVAGVAALVGFVLVESRARFPLIELDLFGNRPFVAITLAGAVANAAYAASIFLSTLFLQDVRGLTPAVAAAVFIAMSVGAAASGLLSGHLGRFHPHWIMSTALGVGGVGTILVGLAFNTSLGSALGWPAYVTGFLLVGLGLGLGWAYASVGTQMVIEADRAGAASGVTLTVLVGVGAIAVAVASTGLEALSSASQYTAGAIDMLLYGFGAVSLLAAILMPVVGRVDKSQIQTAGA